MNRGRDVALERVTIMPQQARIMFHQQSVSESTLRKYMASVKIFKAFIAQKKATFSAGYEDVDELGNEDIFAHFLVHLAITNKSHKKPTAEGYRCSILHHQRTYRLHQWSATRDCRSIVDGYAYQGKRTDEDIEDIYQPKRAMVTVEIHKQMIAYARVYQPHLTDALELGFRIALRPHELISLSHGCYDHRWEEVTIPDKRANARNDRPLYTRKGVFDRKARQILERLDRQSTIKGTSYWAFNLAGLRDMWNIMADDMGLDERDDLMNIKLDGPHCLRHGGMEHLKSRTLEELQVTAGIKARYTKPNHKRTRN